MIEHSAIAIDPSESFEHLPRAPIVEAVIQFRARAERIPEAGALQAGLRDALPEYARVRTIGGVSVTLQVDTPPPTPSPEAQPVDRVWLGLRVETDDGLNVGMFTRDFFSFSRLKPYEDWTTFSAEAMRLWEIHMQLCGPSEIARLGVRFINRFEAPLANLNPGDYLKGVPAVEGEFLRSGFLFRDELAVPGHPYAAVLMRTIQPGVGASAHRASLLLDVDVFTLRTFAPQRTTIEDRMKELHWLKNRIFFENVTEKALELCR